MSENGESMGIQYQIGDATRLDGGDPKIIVHICNDAGGWGRGFVAALSWRWHEPEKRYRAWHRGEGSQPFALGQVQFVQVEDSVWVANLIGQHGMGTQNGLPPIRYDAVQKGLRIVAAKAKDLGASVQMPRIGCGLAGGKWDEIEPIVRNELIANNISVTVYDLPQRQQPRQFSSSQIPTPEQISTAIDVLEKLTSRIDDAAAAFVSQLPESEWADRFVEHLEAQAIELTDSIHQISSELQNWHDELSQQSKQSISCRI